MPSAADVNAITADPVQADVATNEATASATYTDLTTTGPTASSISMVNGQKAMVTVSCRIFAGSVNSQTGYMSFAVSGATTLAGSDSNAAYHLIDASNDSMVFTRMTVFTATATGSHTFTAKYRSTGGFNSSFVDRRIIVKTG